MAVRNRHKSKPAVHLELKLQSKYVSFKMAFPHGNGRDLHVKCVFCSGLCSCFLI